MKNTVKPHKLTPAFSDVDYTVVQRSGNELLLQDGGREIRRNVSHVKKVPLSTDSPSSDSTTEANRNDTTSLPVGEASHLYIRHPKVWHQQQPR